DTVTDGLTIRQNWDKTNFLVSMDPALRGRSGPASHQIVAKPAAFVRDLSRMELPNNPDWATLTGKMRSQTERCAALPTESITAGPASMDALRAHLVPPLPHDAMVTFGAGEHTSWVHRYFPTHHYGSLISARKGSMGYSIPSAITVSLNNPEKCVVSVAGDG